MEMEKSDHGAAGRGLGLHSRWQGGRKAKEGTRRERKYAHPHSQGEDAQIPKDHKAA